MIPHQANYLSEEFILFVFFVFGEGSGQAVQAWLLQHLTAWKNGLMEAAEMKTLEVYCKGGGH